LTSVIAQIAGGGVAEEIPNLDVNWLVQPHAFDQLRLQLWRRTGTKGQRGRITRHQKHHCVHRQHDHEKDQDRKPDALGGIAQHDA
jgi:hypothetical protein